MNRSFLHPLLGSVLLAVSQHAALSAEEHAATKSPRLSREDTVLVTITASVEGIDLKNRELTLKGPLGNSVEKAEKRHSD
jgi:hypothetical protein